MVLTPRKSSKYNLLKGYKRNCPKGSILLHSGPKPKVICKFKEITFFAHFYFKQLFSLDPQLKNNPKMLLIINEILFQTSF